jgi:hypothetical protein
MKIFFTLITILLAFIIPSFIDAQVNKQDSLALVDLYNSTGGLHWKNNTNWLTVNPVNKWYGITVEKNRVVEINLYFNQLNGSISPADLSNNKLTGSVSPGLGNLNILENLNLSHNCLTGNIPATFSNLKHLNFWI